MSHPPPAGKHPGVSMQDSSGHGGVVQDLQQQHMLLDIEKARALGQWTRIRSRFLPILQKNYMKTHKDYFYLLSVCIHHVCVILCMYLYKFAFNVRIVVYACIYICVDGN